MKVSEEMSKWSVSGARSSLDVSGFLSHLNMTGLIQSIYKVIDLGRLLNSQVQRSPLTISQSPAKAKPEQAPVLGSCN